MPDNDAPSLPATPQPAGEGQNGNPVVQSTAPLTVEAITAALLPAIDEAVRKHTKPAYDAARRAEAKAERAPDSVMRSMAPLQKMLEDQALQSMPEEQRNAYLAGRNSERQTREDPQAAVEREQQMFRSEAASVLDEEGIDANDPLFVAAYQRFGQSADTPAKWRTALGRSIAAVHKERAATEIKTVKSSVDETVKKVRDEAEVKTRNADRTADGHVDRGLPAAPVKGKDWLRMDPTGKEFAEIEAKKEADRRTRRIAASR